MTRWRYTVWLTDRPEVKVKKHRQSNCRQCVINQCAVLVSLVAGANDIEPSRVSWMVERLRGVVDGWEIVCTSDTAGLRQVKRHAHT